MSLPMYWIPFTVFIYTTYQVFSLYSDFSVFYEVWPTTDAHNPDGTQWGAKLDLHIASDTGAT